MMFEMMFIWWTDEMRVDDYTYQICKTLIEKGLSRKNKLSHLKSY
jgi:hypothetical protein